MSGRIGSGSTTDTTSTSNTLFYAGEGFKISYNIGVGKGSKRVQTDLTDFVITAKAIRMDVPDGVTSNATPATSASAVTLEHVEVDYEQGEFFVYIPKTILTDVGFSIAPTAGNPDYIGFAVSYEEPTGTYKESRIIEADLLGFRYNWLYTP